MRRQYFSVNLFVCVCVLLNKECAGSVWLFFPLECCDGVHRASAWWALHDSSDRNLVFVSPLQGKGALCSVHHQDGRKQDDHYQLKSTKYRDILPLAAVVRLNNNIKKTKDGDFVWKVVFLVHSRSPMVWRATRWERELKRSRMTSPTTRVTTWAPDSSRRRRWMKIQWNIYQLLWSEV